MLSLFRRTASTGAAFVGKSLVAGSAPYALTAVPRFGVTQNAPNPFRDFQKLSEKDLNNLQKVNLLIQQKHPKRSPNSYQNLYHGRQRQTGNQISFSEHKTRRYWLVNKVQQQHWKSDILQRKIRVRVSTTALRNMRKYGGFDNYVLLTKPKNLDSTYGEYLRRLMLEKLKDPKKKINYIARSQNHQMRRRKARWLRWQQKPAVLLPPQYRYEDLSHMQLRLRHQMSRNELKKFNELHDLNRRQEDVPLNHPIIMEINEHLAREEKLMEPERQKLLEKLKKYKSPNVLAKALKVVEDGRKDFLNPPMPKDI